MPKGPPLNNFDTNHFVVGASPGNVSITFDTLNTATLRYTIGGVSGFKNISRQDFGVPEFRYASVVDFGVAPRYVYRRSVGDLWWGGTSQNGWGINIAQQYRTLFAVWYTYGIDGRATWFVMPGGAWNDDLYEGDLYATSGSAWLGANYDSNAFTVNKIGTIGLGVLDNNNARLTYTFTAGPFAGTNQTKSIVRQPF
jgi:hypothetical protein